MQYYNIAGFNFALTGFENEYFEMRLAEYKAEPTDDISLWAEYEDAAEITIPDGKEIAFEDGYRKYYELENGCGIYDVKKDGTCIAALEFDKNASRAKMRAVDITDCGGVPNNIRSLNMLGEFFRYFMLTHGGIVMHSSCLQYKGNGMMFSAPSGTGKSTHTSLWRERFGADVEMINDDSPAVKFAGDKAFVCGTPWSGKTEINHNITAPLKAIVMLRQHPENVIKRIAADESVFLVMREVRRPVFADKMNITLDCISKIVENVPIYMLGCNISQEAAELVEKTVFGG